MGHTLTPVERLKSFGLSIGQYILDATIQIDVSGLCGCAAFFQGRWFQWQWSLDWTSIGIMAKTLTPIILSRAAWRNTLWHQGVLFHCVNKSHADTTRRGLDSNQLHIEIQCYFIKGLAWSTNKTYHAGQNHYLQFCQKLGVTSVLTSERTLLMFIAHFFKDIIGHTSIKTYFAAIRHLHVSVGMYYSYTQQLSPYLELVIRGIKKTSFKQSHHGNVFLFLLTSWLASTKYLPAPLTTSLYNDLGSLVYCLFWFSSLFRVYDVNTAGI